MSQSILRVVGEHSAHYGMIQDLAVGLGAQVYCHSQLPPWELPLGSTGATCAILDLDCEGVGRSLPSGRLAEAIRSGPPCILIAVPCADLLVTIVECAREGADFVASPPNRDRLQEAAQRAWKEDESRRTLRRERSLIESRLRLLTMRERQVLERVVTGCANKRIAAELHLSQKTVEAHRSKVMHKMEAESLATLIHMLYAGGMNTRLAPIEVLHQRSSPTASFPSMDPIDDSPFAANVMGRVNSESVR